MFETVKRLYLSGKLSSSGLQRAVDLGWITENQLYEIIGTKK